MAKKNLHIVVVNLTWEKRMNIMLGVKIKASRRIKVYSKTWSKNRELQMGRYFLYCGGHDKHHCILGQHF